MPDAHAGDLSVRGMCSVMSSAIIPCRKRVSLAKTPSGNRCSVSAVLVYRTGTKDGLCGADPMDPCEDRFGCLDAHAHAFAIGSASQLAPDFSQAARRYR